MGSILLHKKFTVSSLTLFNYFDIRIELLVSHHDAYCPPGVLSADTAKHLNQWKRTSVLSVEFKK